MNSNTSHRYILCCHSCKNNVYVPPLNLYISTKIQDANLLTMLHLSCVYALGNYIQNMVLFEI